MHHDSGKCRESPFKMAPLQESRCDLMQPSQISRRQVLLAIGGTLTCAWPDALNGAEAPLAVDGLPVYLELSALSEQILRLTLTDASPETTLKELNADPVFDFASQTRVLLTGQVVRSSQVLTWGSRRIRLT